jgi:hypothetical protein
MGACTTRTGDERDALYECLALPEILHHPKDKNEMVRNSGERFFAKVVGRHISRGTYPSDICRARLNLPFFCAAVRETGQDVLRVQAVERSHCKEKKKGVHRAGSYCGCEVGRVRGLCVSGDERGYAQQRARKELFSALLPASPAKTSSTWSAMSTLGNSMWCLT